MGMHGNAGSSFFDTLVDDRKELIKHFEGVLVVFIRRFTNTVAHVLAQVTYSLSGLREWHDIAPDCISCNLERDQV